jgi:type I restriction enzyme S subunit
MKSDPPPGWTRHLLGDVADVAWGDTKTTKSSYVQPPDGYPAFSASGPDGRLPHYDYDRDGIVLSAIGANCGRVYFARGKWSCIKNTIRFWGRPKVANTRFLFYATSNSSLWPKRGSAQPFISQGDARKVEITLPSVPEQERIASVLGTLDDKIDSNRRLTVLLEETAATMFRARFVDFIGQSHFVETELGRVPRNWTVARIGDALNVVGGGTPSTKESKYWKDGTHCWATPKDLAGAISPVLLDTKRHLTDEGVSRISSRLLPKRTVLLSSRAPVGYTAMSMVDISVNQGFIAIPPSDSVPSEYVLFWLRANLDRIKAHAGGTTFAEISKRAFRPLLMVVPPPDALTEFERLAKPMFDRMAAVGREIQVLSSIGDALLPRLVSGEIRVPEANDSHEVIGAVAGQVAA